MKKELIRKTWPKIRPVIVKGEKFFQVDARRKGTSGRRETFAKQDEAEERAGTIAAEFAGNGSEGLAMPAGLRAMAFQGQALLEPYGKTVLQACQFYRDFLATEKEKAESALIETLADSWFKDKSHKKHKLKPPTIRAIRQTANLLKKRFGKKRIKELTKADAEKFVFSLNGEYQQEGTRNRSGQFFNWCIAKEFTDANPFSSKVLTVTLPDDDIEIFDAARTKEIVQLCEKEHQDILVYVVICFFAGLRPGEAEQLTWENIHLKERQIHVLGSTSKSGVTHNVDIEENLAAWLTQHRPAKDAKGFICPQGKTLQRKRQQLHAALGYKAAGENQDAPEIVQDIMRHSYASHWQAKYTNAHKLAEMMANSVEVIRDHYKKVVSKKEIASYWSILPKGKEKVKKQHKETALENIPAAL